MDAARVLQPGTQISVRGERWTVVAHTHHADCTSVRVTGTGRANRDAVRTFLLPFDRARPAAVRSRPAFVARRRWIHEVRRMLVSCHAFGGIPVAVTASVDLLPFQLEPALAMLRHGKLRLLIADEVGLGKTVQAGMILAQLGSDDTEARALVITPAGLRTQWRDELRSRFALEATVADTAWLGHMARSLPPDVNPWSLPGTFITSIDLVKRPEVLRALEEVTWDATVIDEAHNLGATTARLEAADALARRSRRVVLLTATPPYGDPAQMNALTSVGRFDDDDPVTIFHRTRSAEGLAVSRRSVLLPVRISAHERRMHRALDAYAAAAWRECERRGDPRGRLAIIVLRKRALSSAFSLLLSLRRRLALLSGAATRLSDEWQLSLPLDDETPLPDAVSDAVIGARALSDGDRECDWLRRLITVAERASRVESKVRVVRRLLRRIREPAVVFTEYRDTLAHLASSLSALAPLLLHGGMTVSERDHVQRAFASGGTLLLATDAASEGLNLHQRCRLVVHFELPWTPMRLEQRCGRVDRLGQRRRVHEILLVARHTAERLVLAPLFARLRNAAAAGDAAASTFTENRVAELLVGATADHEAAPPSTAVRTATRLLTEAQAEAGRLASLRRLALPPRIASNASRVPLLWWRTSLERATLLVRVALETTDGRVLATDLLPVCVTLALRRPITRRIEAAALASELMHQHGQLIWTAVERHLEAAPGDRERAEAVHHALADREARMRDHLPSAASRMVQAGLFDRRTVIEAERRRRISTDQRRDAERRLAAYANPPCRTRLSIVAIHLGSDLCR